jgi:hypothetical protein
VLDLDGLIIGPCMAVFGEPVAYYGTSSLVPGGTGTLATQVTGSPVTVIQGVYDESYLPLQPLGANQPGLASLAMGALPNITAALPVLGIRAADLPVPPEQGDRLTVRGQDFLVREVQADGHGGIKLLLNAALAPP